MGGDRDGVIPGCRFGHPGYKLYKSHRDAPSK
jgi:hypothetical protein